MEIVKTIMNFKLTLILLLVRIKNQKSLFFVLKYVFTQDTFKLWK